MVKSQECQGRKFTQRFSFVISFVHLAILINAAELKVWPLLSLLNGVDALVGGGGYNLVNEARATGTPLFVFSLERRYDRQRRRLKTSECVSDVSKIVSGIQFLPKRSVAKTYVNGAHKAVDLIESSCA